MGDPYSSNLSGEGQSLDTTALQSSGGNLTLISSLTDPYQIFLDKTVRFTCLNRRPTGQESLLGNLTGAKKNSFVSAADWRLQTHVKYHRKFSRVETRFFSVVDIPLKHSSFHNN